MNRGLAGYCMIAVLVACAGFAFVGATAGGAAATTGNVTVGAEVSSFMQASSVETTGEVEEGTFEAALNRTDDPEQRRALIEQRQQRLEERNRQLRSQRQLMGRTPDVRNRSLATRVAIGAAELERSVNGTERAAVDAGLDTEGLAKLRANASSLRGPEVAELARDLAGPPDGVPGAGRGSPADAPGLGEDMPAANRTDRTGVNRSGSSANRSIERKPGAGSPGTPEGPGGPPSDPGSGSNRPTDGPAAPTDDDRTDDSDTTDNGKGAEESDGDADEADTDNSRSDPNNEGRVPGGAPEVPGGGPER